MKFFAKLSCIFYCILLTNNLYAVSFSDPYLDSLKQSINYSSIIENSLVQLEDSARLWAYENPNLSIIYSLKIIEGEKNELNIQQINAYYNIISQLISLTKYTKAKALLNEIKTGPQKNNIVNKANIALIESLFCFYENQHHNGISKAREAIKYYKQELHPNIIRAYGNIALFLNELHFFKESVENFEIAFSYYDQFPDYEERIKHITNFTAMIINKPFFHSDQKYLDLATKMNNKLKGLLKDKKHHEYMIYYIADNYFLKKLKGEKKIDPSQLIYANETILKERTHPSYSYLKYALADFYTNYTNETSLALQFAIEAEKAAIKKKFLQLQYYIQNLKSKIHLREKNIQGLYQSKLLSDSLYFKLLNYENRKLIAQMETQLKNKEIEIENEITKKKNQRQSYLLLISILIIITIFIFFWRNLKYTRLIKKNQNSLRVAFDELKEKNLIIQNQKLNLKKNNIRLKSDLKSNLSLMVNYNEKFKKIITLIEQKTELKNNVKEKLNRLFDDQENKKILEDLNIKFNEMHPDFRRILTSSYPNLTAKNIKLCIYLKMNLSTKEIASITHSNIGAVKVAISRLRKKLDLNPSIKLSSFFNSL